MPPPVPLTWFPPPFSKTFHTTPCLSFLPWSTPPSPQAIFQLPSRQLHNRLSWHPKLQTCTSSVILSLKPWNTQSTTNCPPPVFPKTTSLTQISQDCSLHWDGPPHGDRVTLCHQSLILLISPHSPWLILCLRQSTTKSSSPLWLNLALLTLLVHIIPDKLHLSGQMEWHLAQTLHSEN